MIQIQKSQEMSAPMERVWALISNTDDDQKYWLVLKDIKVLSKTENKIEREAMISRGPLGNAKSSQTLILNPSEKSISLSLTRGPMLGTRKIVLSPLGSDKTKMDVDWEIEMRGVPGFSLGFVKENISDVTEKALKKIAESVAAN